ncbi:MAG: M90 family metallopeptidase [Rubrivivax sp.]
MASWLRRIGAHLSTRREARALQRRAIADDLWKRTLVRYPFLQRRDPADQAMLRRLTSLFLDRKEFTSAGGLQLTDAMVVAVAAQAVLPVLRLGLPLYDGFVGIVMHPGAVVAQRETIDEDGVVHAYEETLSGEAMDGGPIMLSWQDVRGAGHTASAGYNVVIHEFAHVLDLATGNADGMPALPREIDPGEWRATWATEFDGFAARVDAEAESGAASATVLNPYGASDPAEFFAVASEAFFVNPAGLCTEHAPLYQLLARYYRQDPGADSPPKRRR